MEYFGRKRGCRNFKTSSNSERERRDCLPGFGLAGPRDKINYHSKEKITFVSLSYDEYEIFKNSLKTSLGQDSQENSSKQQEK